MEKRVYRFSGNVCDWGGLDQQESKNILGGKGAGLVMMAKAGMPVPPGFIISTPVCNYLSALKSKGLKSSHTTEIISLMEVVMDKDDWLVDEFGYRPLLAVRSGAPVSMPGMMDTILNVGLTTETLPAWEKRIGARAAWDSYRRLIQMLGATAFGIPMSVFDKILAGLKQELCVKEDTDLSWTDLESLVERYKKAFQSEKGLDFPDTRYGQLEVAIRTVFDSWMNPRAIEYRKLNNISEAMGTAVNVQSMVFGNMGDDSGTGVLFTRNPSNGKKTLYGEFLVNAQGEDVVAGIRTPESIDKMIEMLNPWPGIYGEITDICLKLEDAYKDMVDIEFTVQQGQLFVLQSRTGKRSAAAAFQIATDLVKEGRIDISTALCRLTPEQYKAVRRPIIDPKFDTKPNKVGLPACPGVAVGKPVYSSDEAVNCKEPCILITHETTPDDIAGMNAAVGILTQTGGATSHAAVVARAMDRACVVGCTDLDIAAMKNLGVEKVTIDGSTGNVWLQIDVPVIDSSQLDAVKTVGEWCCNLFGAMQGTPLFDEAGSQNQVVQVAHWWGHTEVLEVLLADLMDPEIRDRVVLDIRSPAEWMPEPDGGLVNVFGFDPYKDGFREALVGTLFAKKDELKGLSVVGLGPNEAIEFKKAGFNMVGSEGAPLAAPIDYAVFAKLGQTL